MHPAYGGALLAAFLLWEPETAPARQAVHLLPEVIPYAAGAVLAVHTWMTRALHGDQLPILRPKALARYPCDRGDGAMSKNSNFAIFEIAMISLSVISTALTVWLIFLI